MHSTDPQLAREDLAFMGKINASISHELKNIMAIISETSGLLNDLMEMAAGGETVDPGTIRECCRDIEEEIQRGFATVRQMNRFAHSTDEAEGRVDLDALLDLVTGLAGFLSFACDIRVDPASQKGVAVRTSPFRLQNLVYRALVFAFRAAGPRGEVSLAVRSSSGDGVRIAFSGFGVPAGAPFATPETRRIAAAVGAEIREGADGPGVEIRLPRPGDG